MFFVLSKTLNYLAMPLVVICLLFILSIIFKSQKLKKRLFWLAFGLLLFFSNDFIANEAMRLWEVAPTPFSSISKKYRYGIMLTGVTLTDMEPADRVYFQRGADRVVHTVDLYKRGIIERIIISGGSGRLITESRREADDVFKAMTLMGVDPEHMIIENESRNTYESAVNVKPLVDGGDYLLITSAFHMRRSLACFKKEDWDIDTFSTDFYTHPRNYTPDVLFVPKVEALLIWQKLIKEWVGMVAYKIAGRI